MLAPRGAVDGADESKIAVLHRGQLVVEFAGHLRGGYLVVEATLAPGWHIYAMDNPERARERSGKANPDCELPTRIEVSGGVVLTGDWRQSEPADRSDESLFWYTWGWDSHAVFAAPVSLRGGPQEDVIVKVSAQACTDTSCSMIDNATLVIEGGDVANLSQGEFDFDALSALNVNEESD